MDAQKSFEWEIFERRSAAFVLWTATETDTAPSLVIGKILRKAGSGPDEFTFKKLLQKPLQKLDHSQSWLWELGVGDIASELSEAILSTENQQSAASGDGVYHYWFKVKDRGPNGSSNDVLVTDPFATAVDYRLRQYPDGINQPASVIKVDIANCKLLSCDPSGKELNPVKKHTDGITKVPKNNELVIYELPASWTKATSDKKDATDVGTFRDVLALLKKDEPGMNFVSLDIISQQAILADLGVNGLELLPPTDSKVRDEWGYGKLCSQIQT